jgi:uncharacterized membrane protein required for colicin V production
MIIDLLVIALFLILVARGFSSGFIPTLLGLIGYVGGGFAGLLVAREVTTDWEGLWSVVGLYLLAILIGAKLGQIIARSLGKGVRGIFVPFKFVDSLLGGLLGGVKAIVLVAVSLYFLSALPQEAIKSEMRESQVNRYLKDRAPGFLEDAFESLMEISRG